MRKEKNIGLILIIASIKVTYNQIKKNSWHFGLLLNFSGVKYLKGNVIPIFTFWLKLDDITTVFLKGSVF